MFECFNCGHRSLVWGGDFSFEDYGIEGEGIVHNLTCSVCGCYVEYYCPINFIEKGEPVEVEE